MASAEDLELFPGATDVIRIGSPKWTERYNELLLRLAELARAQCRGARSADAIMRRLSPPPRIQLDDGESWAYLLFSLDAVRLDDRQLPELHVKGLVLEPLAKARASKKGNIVVEF